MTMFTWKGFTVLSGWQRCPKMALVDGFLRYAIRPPCGVA